MTNQAILSAQPTVDAVEMKDVIAQPPKHQMMAPTIQQAEPTATSQEEEETARLRGGGVCACICAPFIAIGACLGACIGAVSDDIHLPMHIDPRTKLPLNSFAAFPVTHARLTFQTGDDLTWIDELPSITGKIAIPRQRMAAEVQNNVIGGYKATLDNLRVGEEAKEHSKEVLKEHGVDT